MDGKWVVITDAKDGMEYETALQLSMKGANLIIGSRNVEKAKKMAQNMTFKTGNAVKSKFYFENFFYFFFLNHSFFLKIAKQNQFPDTFWKY